MISIAIPYHGDRLRWTLQSISNISGMARVKDVQITVDPSNIPTSKLQKIMSRQKKVHVHLNKERLFVFRNKIEAVKKCTQEWVALIDSDNIINLNYLHQVFDREHLSKDTIYQPAIGFPKLNYTEFCGDDIGLKKATSLLEDKNFIMLFNTMNYVFHKETWLAALEEAIKDDYDPLTADAAYINYHCLKKGMVLRVVPNMTYIHTIHDSKASKDVQSTFVLYYKESWREFTKLRERMQREDSECAGNVQAEGREPISQTSNWSGAGRPSRDTLSDEKHQNVADLLTD